MPLLIISDVEKAQGMANLDSELRFMLEEKKISNDVMSLIGHLGISDMSTLAHIEESEAKFRDMIKTEMGIGSDDGMAARVQVAKLIDVWHAARERNAAKNAEATAARVEGRPRDSLAHSFVSVRRQYQETHGKFLDTHFPSKDYVQGKIEQLEEGEVKTESLTEIVSVKEAGDDCAEDGLMFDMGSRKVAIKTTRSRVRVRPPATTEELRLRYGLMKVQFEIVKSKHPDRLLFDQYDPQIWERFVSYLLGPTIAGYSAHSGTTLRWEDLLGYELAMRRAATEAVNDGTSGFTIGLANAMKDGDLKSTYFTLPLTVSGKRGHSSGTGGAEEPAHKALKQEINSLKNLISKMGANKGKSEGKGQKAKASSSVPTDLSEYKDKEILRFRTEGANGKAICTFFQRKACTRKNCKFAHVCWRCHKPGHAIIDCSMPPRLK